MITPNARPEPRPSPRSLGTLLVTGTLILAPFTVAALGVLSRLETGSPSRTWAIASAAGYPSPAVTPARVSPAAGDDCGSAEPCRIAEPAPVRTALARKAPARPAAILASR